MATSEVVDTICTLGIVRNCNVELREGYGRAVIAKTLITKGEKVFSNASFAWLLRGDYTGSRCGTCFRTPQSSALLFCSKCKAIQYCSSTCQKADWPQHKVECSKMVDVGSLKMPSSSIDDILLLNRTLAATKKAPQQCEMHLHANHGSNVTSCGSKHLASMSYGGGDRTDDMIAVIAATCRIFCHPMPAVAQLMAQFRSNNFGVLSDLMGCIGVGVYPQAALLNHSCAPTCLLTYALTQSGPVANIVALRDIQPGEELTHSYIDCSLPTSMRKEVLRSTYGFVCSCPRCDAPAAENETVEDSNSTVSSATVQHIRDAVHSFEMELQTNKQSGDSYSCHSRRPLPLRIKDILDSNDDNDSDRKRFPAAVPVEGGGPRSKTINSTEVDRLITEVSVSKTDYDEAFTIAVKMLSLADQLALFDEEDEASEQGFAALYKLRSEIEPLVHESDSKYNDIASRISRSPRIQHTPPPPSSITDDTIPLVPMIAKQEDVHGNNASNVTVTIATASPAELSLILLRRAVKGLSLLCGPFHIELYRTRGKLMTAALINGNAIEALEQCNFVVAYLCVALSHIPNHPLLGLQLFSLGDLLSSSPSSDCLEIYQWCYSILRYSHSSDSEIIRNLQKFL